jgi:hypothetical protein
MEPQYTSLNEASNELGVSRSTMYYYLEQLGIETKKFPLDRKTYIALVDFERIKEAKKAAGEGRH